MKLNLNLLDFLIYFVYLILIEIHVLLWFVVKKHLKEHVINTMC